MRVLPKRGWIVSCRVPGACDGQLIEREFVQSMLMLTFSVATSAICLLGFW